MISEEVVTQLIITLKEQLAQTMEINRRQGETIALQAKTIEELRVTIVELQSSLAWLKKKVFGKMSEKHKPIDNGEPLLPFEDGGMEIIEADIEEARKEAERQILVPEPEAAKSMRRNRVVMDDLPVVTVVIDPEGIDLDKYVKIGEEHTRTLEMKPGYLYIKEPYVPHMHSKTAGMHLKNQTRLLLQLLYR